MLAGDLIATPNYVLYPKHSFAPIQLNFPWAQPYLQSDFIEVNRHFIPSHK